MELKKMRPCSACSGQGKQKCQRCGGTGKEHLPLTDEEVPCANNCQNGYIVCPVCSGIGQESYIEIVPDPKPAPEPPKSKPAPPKPETTSPSTTSGKSGGKMVGICVIAGLVVGIMIGHPFIGLIAGCFLGGCMSSKKN